MKYLFAILFLLISFTAVAQTSNGCFEAIQDGQVVEVICANKPVFFRDCSNQNATIFYYKGPEAFNPSSYDENKLLSAEEVTTFTEPGEYIITQYARNTVGNDNAFPQTFFVREALPPTLSAFGCSNNRLSLSITDADYDRYTIDFDDGSPLLETSDTEIAYTYPRAGSYTITVTGSFDNSSCSNSNEIPFTTLAPIPQPQISVLQVVEQNANGNIQFTFDNLQSGITYTIERFQDPRTQFVPVETFEATAPTETRTISNINTAEGTLYRINVTDRCGTLIKASESVNSLTLEATATTNGQVDLRWGLFTTSQEQFELYRNGELLQTFDNTARTYADTDVACGQEYCYTIRIPSNSGNTVSISAEQCVTATSNVVPPPGNLITSFNSDNQVVLTLQLPENQAASQVRYERNINSTTYQPIGTSKELTYTDSRLTPPASACYRASFVNACGIASTATNPTCPVMLQASQPDDASVVLSWSDFVGFKDGLQGYTLELLDQDNQVVASYPVTGNTYTDRNLGEELRILRYRIRATSISGLNTFSNIVVVEQRLRLYVPSAFTPNGDGLNDLFEVKGQRFQTFHLKIYNRLGRVIYTSTDASKSWDGTYNGQEMPTGAYVYEVSVSLPDGTTRRRTGTISLLR